MGDYITQADLARRMSQDELVQMTDDAGTGQVDTAVVDQVIADAEAEVNGYLQERYAVPLSPVPDLVKLIAVDLAVWHLYGRRKNVDDAVLEHYKAAVRLLEALAAGKVSLGLADPPAEAGAAPRFDAPGRVFSRDSLKGF